MSDQLESIPQKSDSLEGLRTSQYFCFHLEPVRIWGHGDPKAEFHSILHLGYVEEHFYQK
jgi:hypothetical protein